MASGYAQRSYSPHALQPASHVPGPVFNVRDVQYGAKGDGATDDLAIFQAAAAQIASAGQGTLYIPAGDYAVTLTNTGNKWIAVPSNTHVVFAPNAVLRITADASATGYRCLLVAGDNVRITGGTIIGDTSVAGVGENGIGVYVNGGTNVIIEGVTSRGHRGDGLYLGGTAIRATAQAGGASTITLASGASATDDAYNHRAIWLVSGAGAGQIRLIADYVGSTKVATVDRAWATQPDNTTVYHVFQNTGVTVRDCTFSGNYRNATSVIDAYDTVFENCRFTTSLGTAPEAGVDIEPNASNSVQRCTFRRCIAARNDGSGFEIQGSLGLVRDVVWEDCDAGINGVHGWNLSIADTIALLGCRGGRNTSFGFAATRITDLRMTGGAYNNNTSRGVYWEGVYRGSINGTTISANGTEGIYLTYNSADGYGRAYENNISGCLIRGNGNEGIFAQYQDACTFVNNRIYQNGKEGIKFHNICLNNGVKDNQFFANGQATNNTYFQLNINLQSHYNDVQGNVFRRSMVWDAGTAQAGAASTITLATSAVTSDDYYNGLTVAITSGTGSGQSRTISDYVGSTRVATVSVAWTTPPNATSVYTVDGAVLPAGAIVIGGNCVKNSVTNNDHLQGGSFIDGGISTNKAANRAT